MSHKVPTALKLIRGNPGRRPLPLGEYHPPVEIPSCPRHLQGAGRAEWKRITKRLEAGGLISHLDRGAVAMLCTAWGRYVEAEEMILKVAEQTGGNGMFVKTPNNMPVQSPWLAVSNRAMEMYTRLASEFGLTPSARAKVVASEAVPALKSVAAAAAADKPPPDDDPPDSWGQFKP